MLIYTIIRRIYMYILCPYFNKTGENRGTFFKIQNRNYPKKLANKRLSSHDIRLMPFFQTQLLTNRGVQQGVQQGVHNYAGERAELCRSVQNCAELCRTVQNCEDERRWVQPSAEMCRTVQTVQSVQSVQTAQNCAGECSRVQNCADCAELCIWTKMNV